MKLKEIIEAKDPSYEIMAKLRKMAKGSTGPIATGRKEKEDPYGNRTRTAKKWMADVTAEFEKINRKGGRIDWAYAAHLKNQGKKPKEIAKKVKR